MSITINAGQLTLAQRSGISCFPLVTLQTFSDRDARTVESTYYWTRYTTIIADTGSVHSFNPFLVGISPIVRGFSHLPDQDEYSTREGMRFSLDATPQAGHYIWQEILAENVIGARVTIESIFIDMSTLENDRRWFDLSAFGHVSIPRWRGEITNIPTLSADASTFEMVAESEEVSLGGDSGGLAGRAMTGVPTAHQDDLGVGYPSPIGVQYVKPLWYDMGIQGTGTAVPEDNEFYTDTDKFAELEKHYAPFDFTDEGGGDGYEQYYAGKIRLGSPTETGSYDRDLIYESLTVDEDSGIVDLDETLRTTAVALDPHEVAEGARVVFSPLATRLAISGGPISSVGTLLVKSGDSLYTYENVLTREDYFLENISDGDDGGHVAVLTMCKFHTGNYLHGSLWVGIEKVEDVFSIEVGNPYTVGSSSSVFQAIGSDASNWKHAGGVPYGAYEEGLVSRGQAQDRGFNLGIDGVTEFGSHGEMTDSSGEMTLQVDADIGMMCWWVRDFGTPKSGPVELEFNIELTSADLADINHLIVFSNIEYTESTNPSYSSYGLFVWSHFKEMRLLYPSDLVAGDNVIRQQTFEEDINNIGVRVVWNNYDRSRTITIKSDILSYPIIIDPSPGSHPIEVVERIVEHYLPTEVVSVDPTTFSDVQTKMPGITVSLDLALYPTLGEFLAAVGFNSRINFVLSETASGTVLKAFAADSDYGFPASTFDIGNDFADLKVTYRSLTEIATRFTALYNLNSGGDPKQSKDYQSTVTANETTNNLSSKVSTSLITSSQASFGKREAVDIPFAMLSDSTSVIDVFGYYVNESLRGQVARYSCVVPWWIGYHLEPGDILTILPPWETTNQKVRLLQTVFNFDENGVGLVLESVT